MHEEQKKNVEKQSRGGRVFLFFVLIINQILAEMILHILKDNCERFAGKVVHTLQNL